MSTDWGNTWQVVNNGLTNTYIFSLAVDPISPSTVYAGTSGGGVFVTNNSGTSWVPLNAGLFHPVVTSLSVSAQNHKIIYAGTEGGGVFKNVRP